MTGGDLADEQEPRRRWSQDRTGWSRRSFTMTEAAAIMAVFDGADSRVRRGAGGAIKRLASLCDIGQRNDGPRGDSALTVEETPCWTG